MNGIDNLQPPVQLNIEERQGQQRARQAELPEPARRAAVLRENQRAAMDSLSLTDNGQAGSRFSFEYSAEISGSVAISYQGEEGEVSYQANFSYGFSISVEGEVALNEGLAIDEQALVGPDFEYSREGVLRMFEEMSARFNLMNEPEVDLAGELNDKSLDLLQRLGLLTEDGQATTLLQLLSDYSELNRFQAGQQVGPPRGMAGYGPGLPRPRIIPIAYGLINDLLAEEQDKAELDVSRELSDELFNVGQVADDEE